ncbi:SAM-dependent methyltransferase [Deinococcus metallilatus]|uniref:Methyltransferase domain-containing protein n=1 Tax=Deinococcus metallilatus TaxID=1211322 RepID=A0AAJ5F1J7_9DEIO|nr:class I SAM-dependent methyltransferase [Deinococcus metallilatus]MBB5296676.1 SAM-dependent methyltransferase [Deinococcus metallilatus]QBY09238.1 SAM-dependent methyltransferase [Deinococcus metallilatus]RXJ09759.1 SAM-dependent methyltransferase [Deinococcus metallilatus]TLK24224.1 methyltransferase domain-containing protein [Deinococcus metallilatus]GMA13707.1 methyltransferase type 11 [Deinococcus metallilatus]
MSQVINPFQGQDAAIRYAAGRPFFHPLFMERLAPLLAQRALGADVACGTGLSSMALADVIERVLAFDASEAMLTHAAPHPHVTYAQARAEALPIPDHTLDVLTVAQGFHWFDQEAFLAEARRTLKPEGVLFLYDDFFLGRMPGREDFAEFMKAYGARYPAPPRHRSGYGYGFSEAEARQARFSFQEERFIHPLTFTRPALVAYLLTHSNTIVATDAGRETLGEVVAWLDTELRPFLPDGEERELIFGGLQMVLRPLAV